MGSAMLSSGEKKKSLQGTGHPIFLGFSVHHYVHAIRDILSP
jgi:hypothetical protein